jgi:hypothetical protein
MTDNLYLKIDYPNTSPPTDDGTRPYSGSVPFYNNASIWLEGPSGHPTPSQSSTNVGHPTNVKVRVTNKGPADSQDLVHVQAWVLNPFVGPFDPAHALADALFTGFQNGISSTNVVVCQVNGSPWTPTQNDLDTEGGHLCVVANVYDDNEGGPVASAADLHGPVGTDPHVGQRNIALLPAVSQGLKINVLPGAEPQEHTLGIERVPAARFGQGEQWLLRSRANIALVRDDAGRGRLVLAGRARGDAIPLSFSRKPVVGEISVEGVGSALIRDLTTSSSRRPGGGPDRGLPPGGFQLPALGEPRVATIKVDRSDAPGSLQMFDVVQRDATGRIVGGLRLLSIAPR